MKKRYTLLVLLISASIAPKAFCSQDDDDYDILGIQSLQESDENFKINCGGCGGDGDEQDGTTESVSDWK